MVPERQPLGAGKAFLVFAVYLVCQMVAGALAITVYGLVNGMDAMRSVEDLDPVLFLVAGAAGFVLGGPAILLVTRALQPGRSTAGKLAPLGLVKARPVQLAAAGGLGAVLALVLGYGVEVVFPPDRNVEGPLIQAASAPGWQRIIFVILTIVLAPLVEEFLFRGVLFRGMSRSWGKWPAAVAVTVLFGLLHIADIAGYWPALGVITLVGLVLLLVRIRTGSLWPAIAMHAVYNGVQVVGLYLTV